MKRKVLSPRNGRRAFTFVEALIVTIIAASLMIVIQAFFSHAVRSTIKGQDNLDSIRAASRIFSSLRNDMLQFQTISTDGAVSTIDLTANTIDSTATYSSILSINRADEIITYSFVGTSGRNSVERVAQNLATGATQRQLFGVPRMKEFQVIYLRVPNQINSLSKNVGQILVKLAIDSEDSRFATSEVNLSSMFFSERLAENDWNYLNL